VFVTPEWTEFWRLMAFALAIPVVMMAGVWLLARILNNAGIVDIFWSYGFIPVAFVCAALGTGDAVRSFLLVLMVSIWAARLGTYLLIRVAKHHPEEDGRYATLRTQFPNHTWAMCFGFFEAQGILITLLSVPFVLVFINGAPGLGFFEYAGFLLWLAGIAGEALADAQLNRFRTDPANKGKTCRTGLWSYSRHPNYFCEWLVWLGYFAYALGSPGGWAAVYAPVLMYFFLTRVTGIRATEEHALRSRGEDYRQYQLTTNAFFPWFHRRTS
jgi:steroid 5-alpha reductase family enzyme